MRLKDFDFDLPKELIAQYPSEARDASRLLAIDRRTGKCEHRVFSDLLSYLGRGDLVVLNDTKVLSCRLIGTRRTGGRARPCWGYRLW